METLQPDDLRATRMLLLQKHFERGITAIACELILVFLVLIAIPSSSIRTTFIALGHAPATSLAEVAAIVTASSAALIIMRKAVLDLLPAGYLQSVQLIFPFGTVLVFILSLALPKVGGELHVLICGAYLFLLSMATSAFSNVSRLVEALTPDDLPSPIPSSPLGRRWLTVQNSVQRRATAVRESRPVTAATIVIRALLRVNDLVWAVIAGVTFLVSTIAWLASVLHPAAADSAATFALWTASASFVAALAFGIITFLVRMLRGFLAIVEISFVFAGMREILHEGGLSIFVFCALTSASVLILVFKARYPTRTVDPAVRDLWRDKADQLRRSREL